MTLISSSSTSPVPVLLIDASIYIFRYYFALPDNWFSEKEGWPTAAVYGYTTFLLKLLQNEQPKRVAACFDESLTSCFRNDIYPEYKSSRGLPDEGLVFQLSACRRVTELLGIQSYGSDTYEADDLLASLYQQLQRSKLPIALLTRDKDLGQVLKREQDFLWDYFAEPKKNATTQPDAMGFVGTRYYPKDIQKKLGVWPQQLVDYLALVGDAIDDIPGVPGVGKQTAQLVLSHFGSLRGLFEHSGEIAQLPIRGASGLASKLQDYREQITMAQQLARLVVDLRLIDGVADINWQTPKWPQLAHFCRTMGFPKLEKTINTFKKSRQRIHIKSL